jgi:tripartite-type tricarboxylate transporter receptor subunit TctC
LNRNMTPTRRQILVGAAASTLIAAGASAQSRVLDRTARIVVGYPGGGAADIFARLYAERLAGSYAPGVIVDNRPGASARLAAETVRAAAPDGATILCTPESVLTITPHIYPSTTRYDGLADFTPVSAIASVPFAFCVAASHPARSLDEFLAWAERQSEIPYSSPAAGSTPQLLAELMAKQRKLKMTHVSYRGTGAALVDLQAGRIAAVMATLGDLVEPHRAGTLHILAVTSPERMPGVPEVPSFAERGLTDITGETWNILALPAKAPAAIVEALHATIVQAAADEPLRTRLEQMEAKPTTCTPAELVERLRAETARWKDVVRTVGFTTE